MKTKGSTAALLVIFLSLAAACPATTKSSDPCENKSSNLEMRECYSTAQAKANAEADSLAARIATAFRKESDDSENDGVSRELMQKAADAVAKSQESWRHYRDQYCKAVQLSWTTGSGAGTAYEACLFNLASERVRALRSDFGAYLKLK